MKFDIFLIWLWPWSIDLGTQTWPRYCKECTKNEAPTFNASKVTAETDTQTGRETDRQRDRKTDLTEIITLPTWQIFTIVTNNCYEYLRFEVTNNQKSTYSCTEI